MNLSEKGKLLRSRPKRFHIDRNEANALIHNALKKTYATKDKFDNESDFKFELYHQMYNLRLNGHNLGAKLPGYPTCLLHSESKPENGNASKADLLICNPTKRNSFNYRAEVVVELKKNLNAKDLSTELKKFSHYIDNGPRRLYIIPANNNTLTEVQKSQILSSHHLDAGKVVIFDRSVVQTKQVQQERAITGEGSLLEYVSECITATLDLYGDGRRQYHGFFWCNYEHEQSKGWTFPAEGDFNAQLYHHLRSEIPRGITIQTEYRPRRVVRAWVDFFIKSATESVGIEVKMNWDQFKQKYKNKDNISKEARSILTKFEAMNRIHSNHSNILVVIQGEHAHRSNHKSRAMNNFSRGNSPVHLFYYDEWKNSAVGPILV